MTTMQHTPQWLAGHLAGHHNGEQERQALNNEIVALRTQLEAVLRENRRLRNTQPLPNTTNGGH